MDLSRPETTAGPVNVVGTVVANCQDCYRCVRACPVKAIRVSNGQACIEDELCIRCGTCVKECPQHAKTIVSSLENVKKLITTRKKVAASIAPSFAAAFPGWRSARLPSALRRLGFTYVSETAEGAKVVSENALQLLSRGSICTACPVVVNYVEKYKPEYVDMLLTVTSPMITHGRMLKKRLGDDCAVVFIGPCAAKKQEALRPENLGAVDEVLTFKELTDWLEEEKIDLANCTESGFENIGDFSDARLFPIEGGMLKTCGISCDGTERNVIHLSGYEDVMDLFDMPIGEWKYTVAEPLFCKGGCINGPGFPRSGNTFKRRQDVLAYVESAPRIKSRAKRESIDTAASFTPEKISFAAGTVDESKIQQALEKTGKSDPAFQLNCGACGYRTCRDKAIAVVLGMAEPEMCMPHMRRLAQQRTDRIIETTPNAIVILDKELNMIHMNPAFQKMFMCNNGILGRRISYLVNAEGFEKVAGGAVDFYESIKTKYGVRYHELIYALRDDEQYVGIFSDLSKIKFDRNEIDLIKRQTLEHAKELLNHQIRFAQEMAHFLGRSTARSEELVNRMMELYDEHGML